VGFAGCPQSRPASDNLGERSDVAGQIAEARMGGKRGWDKIHNNAAQAKSIAVSRGGPKVTHRRVGGLTIAGEGSKKRPPGREEALGTTLGGEGKANAITGGE